MSRRARNGKRQSKTAPEVGKKREKNIYLKHKCRSEELMQDSVAEGKQGTDVTNTG